MRAAAVNAHAALLALAPDDSVRRYNLAHALFQAGDLEQALAEAHLALHGRTLDGREPWPPNDSSTRRRAEKALLLGLILEKLGDASAAERYLAWSIELNPAEPLARTRLSQLQGPR
jgi:Flp pilus assembly protein TadD